MGTSFRLAPGAELADSPAAEPRSRGRSSADLRDTLAKFASGVTVTCTRAPDGEPIGMTLTAFSSLSLNPPLVLVCIARQAYSFPHFSRCQNFGISVLSADQGDVATRFATAGVAKFIDDCHFEGAATGVPLIHGSLANLECERRESLTGGDHVILIGRVVGSDCRDGEPLTFFNRTMGRFQVAGPDSRPALTAPYALREE